MSTRWRDTKFTVSKAVAQSGTLILNADDPRLRQRAETFKGNIARYGLSLTGQDAPPDGYAAFVDNGMMTLSRDGQSVPILSVNQFGPALGGAAGYNVSNALGAILLMSVLGAPPEAIKAGLLNFDNTPEDNPGRGNFMDIGGVKTVLDFAHNPHGLAALTKALGTIPANRRLYLCGQAGDRSDEDIYGMTKVIREAEPDEIIIKELPGKLRGRELGEVPALIRGYLSDMDYPAENIQFAASEYDATVKAFEWARPGDLLALLVYAERDKALALMQKLRDENWQPGQPVVS